MIQGLWRVRVRLKGVIVHLGGAEQRDGSGELALHRLARRHVPAGAHIPSVGVAVGPRGQPLREAVGGALVVVASHRQDAASDQKRKKKKESH